MPQFQRKPIAAALCLLFTVPGVAAAQTTPAPEKTLPEVKVRDAGPTDDYNQGVSTVGTRVPTPIRDIPQSVTVINRAVMSAQGATTLADVVRNVPGITIGAAEGGSIGNNINLRGFSARTDLYLDGVRDRGQFYRDVFALEAVEVLKGPSSVMFGRGSTGGVINQVSKVPVLAAHNEITTTLGTQPSLRVTGDFNRPLSDTSALRVSVMGRNVDSTRDEMDYQDVGIAPSLRFGIGTPTEVTLSGLFLHYRDMVDYGLPPVNGRPAAVDRDNFYGVTDDRTLQDVGEASLQVKHRIAPGRTLLNRTQYARFRTDARESGPSNVGTVDALGVYTPILNGNANGNPTTVPLGQLFVAIGSHDRVINDTSLYNQTDFVSEFTTGSLRHTLITGLELGRDTFRNQSYSRTDPTVLLAPGTTGFMVVPLLDPRYGPSAGTVVTTAGNQVNSTAHTVAPYANDTIEITKEWKLVGGLRWDRYDAETSNTINAPASASQTVKHTSVRTGIIYQPTLAQSYYAAYGTSFNPSLETLQVSNGTQNLPPEESRSYELGAKWDFMNGNLSLTSALFQVEKTHARSQVAPGVFNLTGDVHVNGFELGAAGRITPRWQIMGGYTWLDAEIVSASVLDRTLGKTPLNTPEHSATLWSTYNVTREWEVGGGATYLSSRFANNPNTVSVGSTVRLDATLAYHQPRYEIRANLLNVANRRNYDALIASDGGRSVPGIDRTLLVTFGYKF
jgi:catecholate siderophore receptor